MPVKVAKRGNKYRVIEAHTGNLARNKSGGVVDGGGFKTKEKAQRQVRAINANMHKKGKI